MGHGHEPGKVTSSETQLLEAAVFSDPADPGGVGNPGEVLGVPISTWDLLEHRNRTPPCMANCSPRDYNVNGRQDANNTVDVHLATLIRRPLPVSIV